VFELHLPNRDLLTVAGSKATSQKALSPKVENLGLYNLVHARRRGAILLEILIGIMIMGIIAVAILARHDMVNSANESTQLISDITAIQAGMAMQQLSPGRLGEGSLNKAFIQGNRVPNSLKINSEDFTIKTQAGSEIEIYGAGDIYSITITNVSQPTCINALPILSHGWGLVHVSASLPLVPPITHFDAVIACSSDAQTIVLTSKVQ